MKGEYMGQDPSAYLQKAHSALPIQVQSLSTNDKYAYSVVCRSIIGPRTIGAPCPSIFKPDGRT